MSLTALAIALSLSAAPILAATSLSAAQWENRVLVLFADEGDPRYGEQQRLLEAVRDGLAERDMLVLGVTENGVTMLFGDLSGFGVHDVRQTAAGNMAQPFEAVLIGKDGSVKKRWTVPVKPDVLFAIIDAMPMRANEMKR